VLDAALVYYGASMLLAAFRGCAGCEVVAVSNWVRKAEGKPRPGDRLARRSSTWTVRGPLRTVDGKR
jgi:hypothetical protein